MARSGPITAQQWAQVQRLLDELELLPRIERREALATREILDARVRIEVEGLLEAELGSDGFLEDSPWQEPPTRTAAPALPPGTVLGSFRVEDLIGRGGMAEVYRAQRIGDFEQRVAIKLISGSASKQLDAFQRERRILATLEHTGISRIVDGGITDGGRSYMVMEYVEGTDLIRHAQERGLGLSARLDLFRQVCEAVSFAHRHLVIHRDLKPGNIRVTPEGQVKLLDFGVAKLLLPEGRTEDFETATILTPEFAAPEQLYGLPVTTAADVYALGAVLFHLLCGVPPFRTEGRAMHLVIDQMLRSEVPQPSSVAAQQAEPPIPPRLLRGDLDAIVARATRKKPADRYPTVDELWADLARYLAHLPVAARRGNTLYEISRSLRRHRVAVLASAAIALAVIGGLVSTMWQARVAMRAEREAVAQGDRTRRIKNFFVATFAGASALHRKDGTPATLDDALDDALRRIETEQGDDPRLQADLYSDFGEIRVGQGDIHGAKTLFERALAIHEKVLEYDDPALANSLQNRGVIETYLGETEAAMPYLKRALAIREQHPEDVEELMSARLALVTAEMNGGQFQSAIDRLKPVIDFGRDAPEARRQMLGDALVRAAYSALQIARLDDARTWAGEALALYEAHFGRNSAFTVTPLRLLARVAATQGDASAESGLRTRALEVAQSNYPDGHPDVVAALVELGLLELRTGDLPSGENHLTEAIRVADRLKIDDGNLVRAHIGLVRSSLRRNRLDVAHTTADDGIARCQGESLRDEQALCSALRGLAARVSLAAGERPADALLADAQGALKRVLEIRTLGSAGNDTEFDVADARMAVAEILAAAGRHAEAVKTLRDVVATRRKSPGGIGEDIDGARWRLAAELAQLGIPDGLVEAEKLLRAEKAGDEADQARRELAWAELERARGRIEVASAHAQNAVRGFAALGDAEARSQVLAGQFAATLH
ncbi:serine/threonine-protein kinase [Panacagrimonas perspica]|uniref:Serine/threonine-protein kinase n=1 Tax=Panacagrimonas perspica TaxID=381431 RepID=A0A4R7P9X8_9GAMM|nr:serine/threonine-protein kinase [Panacagrimonas perspica]TDU30825.1 serine/threonine-protein kinase [Panacagrimonas perspica]THD01636.1 hypothetical protein B1810_19215 [Panacagrimonas perspica]